MDETLNNPVLQAGEYQGVLKPRQTLNYKELAMYEQKSGSGKASPDEMNAMLEDILRQPIMSHAYRRNGITPEQVDEFIETTKQLPDNAKDRMIRQTYSLYGSAARQYVVEDSVRTLKVGGEREWMPLATALANNATINQPMEKFAQLKQAEASSKKKTVKQWLQEKATDATILVTGVVSAVAMTLGGKQLMKITANEDMAKVTTAQKQKSAPENGQKTAYVKSGTQYE